MKVIVIDDSLASGASYRPGFKNGEIVEVSQCPKHFDCYKVEWHDVLPNVIPVGWKPLPLPPATVPG